MIDDKGVSSTAPLNKCEEVTKGVTRDDLARAVADLDACLSNRIVVTRIIVDEQCEEVGRFSRSYLHRRVR